MFFKQMLGSDMIRCWEILCHASEHVSAYLRTTHHVLSEAQTVLGQGEGFCKPIFAGYFPDHDR